jgi:hypothetical protein
MVSGARLACLSLVKEGELHLPAAPCRKWGRDSEVLVEVFPEGEQQPT